MTHDDLMSSALTVAQILVAVLLFSRSLTPRPQRGARLAATAAGCVATTLAMAILVPGVVDQGQWAFQAAIFVLSLGISFCFVLFIFEASPWTALFCASTGYAMQNLASSVGSLVLELFPAINGLALRPALTLVLPFALVYPVVWRLLIARVRKEGLELIRPQMALPLIILVIFAVICFDVVVKSMSAGGCASTATISCRLAHILLCTLVLVLEYELLYNRSLLEEVVSVTRVMEGEREQYRLSKETIEAINLKCHDIRHQIRALADGNAAIDPGFVDDVTRSVDVYDAAVRTGNEPLDVILTEKSLVCSRARIGLSCIADGGSLAFMAPADLYSLVGNALDNAIEAVSAIEEPERRSVSVVIRSAGGMASIHVENYFSGTVEFRDGLPLTTKADAAGDAARHGFGVKSMRLVAERYGGTLHARTRGDVFHLNVMIPVPEA